jgi:methionyl-tRNA synthetase
MAEQYPNPDLYEICANCNSYRFIGQKCESCDMAADPQTTDDSNTLNTSSESTSSDSDTDAE